MRVAGASCKRCYFYSSLGILIILDFDNLVHRYTNIASFVLSFTMALYEIGVVLCICTYTLSIRTARIARVALSTYF